jgi:hypothetical protein
MMRRNAMFLLSLAAVAPALAMQQGAASGPKVQTPAGWPLLGYLVAGVLFVAAVFLSVHAANRSDLDDSGASS